MHTGGRPAILAYDERLGSWRPATPGAPGRGAKPGEPWRPLASASRRTHSRNAWTSGRWRAAAVVMRQQRSGASAWVSKTGSRGAALQFVRDQHRASDGDAEPADRGLYQHAVETEARGARQVGRGLALAGRTSTTSRRPSPGRRAGAIGRGRPDRRAGRVRRAGPGCRRGAGPPRRGSPRAGCPRGWSPGAGPRSRRCRRTRRRSRARRDRRRDGWSRSRWRRRGAPP